jgi:hypothetical protein
LETGVRCLWGKGIVRIVSWGAGQGRATLGVKDVMWVISVSLLTVTSSLPWTGA